MKKNIYFLCVSLFTVFGEMIVQAQSAPENFDVGIFPCGTFDQTNTANQQFEVAIKPNQAFPAIPAAAELNFYVEVPLAKINGDEVYGIAENQLNGGTEAFQSAFELCNKSFCAFVYNGSGINLSLYPVNTWKFVFTVTIANIAPGVASDYIISDQNSCLYSSFEVRTALNVLFYNEFLPVSSMGSLPVRLMSFTAEKSGDKDSQLNWVTATESNSSYFGIERSFDKINWQPVGKVNAAGNSQLILNYQFTDKNVTNGITSGNVTAYYRLKMVDLDGSFKYSPIQSVNFGKLGDESIVANEGEFIVYPNPASEGVHVEWDANQVDQPTLLEFYDVSGKLIFSEKVEDQTSQLYVDFTKTNIEAGLCLMRVMSGDKPIQFKQIVVGKNH